MRLDDHCYQVVLLAPLAQADAGCRVGIRLAALLNSAGLLAISRSAPVGAVPILAQR